MDMTRRQLEKVLILFTGDAPDGDDVMELYRLSCEHHNAVLKPGRGALSTAGPFSQLSMDLAYAVIAEREGKDLPTDALQRTLYTEYRHPTNGGTFIVCMVQEADDSTPGFLEPAVNSPLWQARNSASAEQQPKKKWSLKRLMGRE
jgi:hypothetical protein